MKKYLFLILIFGPFLLFSQHNESQIYGDFRLNMQSYQEDEIIGAEKADEVILNNSYLNIFFNKGKFTTGLRYESYLNALLDFDRDYRGNGVTYIFATYTIDDLEVTAGNYYEQLGSGMIFRSYENKDLGFDNAMDGVRLKYMAHDGIYLKAFIGKSRTYFTYSEGIIRGGDVELNINDAFSLKQKTKIIFGSSFVSRFQEDNNPKFNLPQNVGVYSNRINLSRSGINYYAEYAYKLNDPKGSLTEGENNYAAGNGIITNLTYSKKGFGISVEMHRVDNMEFRSERQTGKQFIINYIPTLSKQHGYTLLTLNPSATQASGEFGYQADMFYKIKKGHLFGGRYGTKINANYSKILGLKGGNSVLTDNLEHTAPFIGDKNNLFFSDFNLEIVKKINKKLKTTAILSLQQYNKDVMEGKTIGEYGIVESKIGVIDLLYKIKSKHSIRIEAQTLIAEKGEGDWSMGLIEYTVAPNWFITIQDIYNWGNKNPDNQLHYFNCNIGYTKGRNRFEIGYGKKRAGVFCVGGVCKEVPSSNGFNLNISSTF